MNFDDRINIANILSSKDDFLSLENVIESIINKKCIAFIGAGLSVSEGYPTWDSLILGSYENGSLTKDGLLQYVGLTNSDIPIDKKDDLMEVSELCKLKDINKYYDFIIDKFGKGNSLLKYGINHTTIWRIPFQSVLTTNFDSCLYDAASNDNRLHKIFVSPVLSHNPECGYLYHLHGIAFELDDKRNYKETIVLSASEYAEYYNSSMNDLMILFYKVLSEYSLLYVGFSMNDINVKKIMKHTNTLLLQRKSLALKKLQENIDIMSSYILLPEQEVNLNLVDELLQLNINVISYKPQSDFSGLQKLLFHIYNKTNGTPLLQPGISLR